MDLPNALFGQGQGHNDEVRQMVEALPPGSNEYDAEGLKAEDLEELLQQTPLFTYTDSEGQQHDSDRYTVFKNVAPDTIHSFSNQRHLGRIKDLASHCLIIIMPSRDHESATRYFDTLIEGKLNEMRARLFFKLRACGSAEVQGTTRKKAPDASYRPRTLPATRSAKWPSLVLEVGYSESATKLRSDASWWLTESQGEVRAVVTLKIFRKHRVHLEVWQFRDGATRPRPVETQEATVTKSARGYSASGTIVIRFQDLFLRPAAGNGERDIVLNHADLEELVELALKD
ncbi:hypothetical protein MGYG_06823 [Nannizzia gypsea CBS 118893]|uniref:Uncharacterized protein n=1 Tax=Arthroderma gypseum (strain ATCC MYA-4604 / CBS 118893) TaxID=535722 RepID=E4V1A9_ARTGP|nr:hypothetical protein MGYG_06823 [Nannizzia gypsea CBS 118893]EFR03824.1 hypothetical protein MGYG_06823 [Nannizzia gypsea CBS 118893]